MSETKFHSLLTSRDTTFLNSIIFLLVFTFRVDEFCQENQHERTKIEHDVLPPKSPKLPKTQRKFVELESNIFLSLSTMNMPKRTKQTHLTSIIKFNSKDIKKMPKYKLFLVSEVQR